MGSDGDSCHTARALETLGYSAREDWAVLLVPRAPHAPTAPMATPVLFGLGILPLAVKAWEGVGGRPLPRG